VSTPFFHTGGLYVFATPLWHRGGTVVLFDGFDPDTFIEGLAEERCTFALTVATQLVMVMTSRHWGTPLPSLRAIMVGGAPCPDAIATRVRDAGYRLRLGYGLTECGPNCFAISDAEAVARPGSVGWPVHYLRTRIATSNDSEAEVGEIGELQLRGPHVFAGYLNDPARTRDAFTSDGWLRTGDLARRDADGAHRIEGRIRQMYISGGENVFPGEVEAALVDCPGVAEVAVIGVPDEKWGEVGCAFVVRSGEATLTDQDVVAHARTRLAGYKIPRTIVFIDDMPRLASGKADRAQLARIPR
jgi:fatty-acyl-CoA synthase